MNYKQNKQIIESLNFLDKSKNYKENVIKISQHETFEHAIAKSIIAIEMIKNGHKLITEAIFKNGKRADIFILDTFEIIEILGSEKIENIINKQKDYPCPIIPMYANKIIKQSINLLK
ncbi:MAG: hypothetical protein ACOC3Z_00550 [Nanoarchaeota archaeon]